MIDAYEQKHGPVEDRSIFDGEIVVPPHLRNMSLTNRLHSGIFGSLSRSRTFLNLPQNARHTFHGSVPDLTRNPFTFNNNNNNHNMSNNNVDDVQNRRMSSVSQYTKITLNTSTTLTLTEDGSSSLSNGNFSDDTKNTFSIDSFDGQNSSVVSRSDDGYKSNSIRSLNDVQLSEVPEDRVPMYTNSLGRPMRAMLRPSIYSTKTNDYKNARAQSMDAYNAEGGYMTLIKTNASNRSSVINRAVSPLCTITSMQDISSIDSSLPMATTTTTFQRKPPPQVPNRFKQTAAGLISGELTLNNMTKFKLPRVSLSPLNVPNPPQ